MSLQKVIIGEVVYIVECDMAPLVSEPKPSHSIVSRVGHFAQGVGQGVRQRLRGAPHTQQTPQISLTLNTQELPSRICPTSSVQETYSGEGVSVKSAANSAQYVVQNTLSF